jgi:hypothetical protein
MATSCLSVSFGWPMAPTTEKPYAQRIASLGLFHRTKPVTGRAKHLKGHCYVFAALVGFR